MNCPDCSHAPHAAGQCKNCNCGQSEICHGNAMESDRSFVITEQDFKKGRVYAEVVTHIKPRKTGD